jgi:hypothetical protein
MLININLCLSDIPKDKIFTSKNGKQYLSICVTERKEPDNYGNDLTAYVNQTKEEREAKQPRQFIGTAKNLKKTAQSEPYKTNKSDLPW